MSLTDMQHQYWVTKQTVLRKLGGKEDECIVSSDAELDAKLELFRSVSESCVLLQRVIDQYQERLCILAQEENALGRLLKDASKSHESVGKHMSSAGKALSYLGQQRIQLRAPLVRLHHEVDTFRARAIADTRSTLSAMERARTEYRADLKWMKAASSQLDPDTGRGLEKFRKAQNQTRQSKIQFDRLTLDCLEKVDLLAAARCNMFSHALIQYQSSMLSFFMRSSQTLQSTITSLSAIPQYNFCVLKELTQNPTEPQDIPEKKLEPADNDQLLFFQDEYTDEKPDAAKNENDQKIEKNEFADFAKEAEDLLGLTSSLLDKSSTNNKQNLLENTSDGWYMDYDLLGLINTDQESPFMTTDLLEDLLPLDLNLNAGPFETSSATANIDPDLNDIFESSSFSNLMSQTSSKPKIPNDVMKLTSQTSTTEASSSNFPKNKQKIDRKDVTTWLQLFSDLDPLANPDALAGSVQNSHST